jgi:hypothetical protein
VSKPYSPAFAPHVTAVVAQEDRDEDGRLVEQRIDMVCEKCGTQHVAWCKTGNPRQHVVLFARAHLHADPLDPALVRQR